jgi:hypothetical protein
MRVGRAVKGKKGNHEWVGCNLRLERCEIKVSFAVWDDSLTRRSRLSLVSGSADERFRSVRGETPHALELGKSTPTDYERLQLLSGCQMQQNSAWRSAV